MNSMIMFLNILKAFIIPEDLTVLLACLHLMRRNACTGNSLMLLHKRISLQYRVFFIDYGPDNGFCVNRLNQNFSQQAPNLAWASYFTYVKVNGQDNYLCVVLDLFSRRVIGWHTASRHNIDLTMTAFKKAYESRGCPQNILFHSDRGSEYTGDKFRQLMDECNCLQSFSKKGYPYDNACCESFFKQMKREELNRRTFHSLEEFRLSCFKYIERYNNRRPHSSLGNLTPTEAEAEDKYWAKQI